MEELQFRRLSINAFPLTKGSEEAAGFDLTSAYNYVINVNDWKSVKTDIQVLLPDGTYGRIASRSGLALEHGINVHAGVIDPDYTGDISVIFLIMVN
jgi:dUTP pyrophosphatase